MDRPELIAIFCVVYAAATILIVKLLPGLPSRKTLSGYAIIPAIVIWLLWPIWAPFIAALKLRARLDRPLYLRKVAEVQKLIEDEAELSASIDDLIERLADETVSSEENEIIIRLARACDQQAHLREVEYPKLISQARAIKYRSKVFLHEIDPPKEPEDWFIGYINKLDFSPNDGEVSRLNIVLFRDRSNDGAWSAPGLEKILEDHLFREEFKPTSLRSISRRPVSVRMAMESVRFSPGKREQRSWTLVLTSSFKASVKRIAQDLQDKLTMAIEELLVDPVTPRGSTILPLGNNQRGKWRYRIGPYRLIYQPLPEQHELRLLSLEHRSKAYH